MAEKKVTNSVLALSSAAVLAIYGAGYARTRDAAHRFGHETPERRPIRAREERPAPITPGTATSAIPPAPSAAPVPTTKVAVAEPRASSPTVTPAPSARRDVASPVHPQADTSIAAGTSETTPKPAEEEPPQAPAPFTVVAPAEPAKSALKDGTYYGWGSCRHGDIQAAVVIQAGKITETYVERCLTRYTCNWVTPIFPRIVAKQGTTYDYVSGATESSDAFQDAVAEALSQAK